MSRFLLLFSIGVSIVFNTNAYSGGNGTTNTPYLIASAADLLQLSSTSSDWGLVFKQTADIDMASATVFEPIGDNSPTKFSGVYDGDGYIITGLTLTNNSASTYFGLFGYVSATSELKNILLDNVSILSTDMYKQVGGLVGFLEGGRIQKCFMKGNISCGESSAVGGIVGSNSGGIVEECYTAGIVTGGANSSIGGIAGSLTQSGVVRKCYSISNIIGGDGSYAGGVVGVNSGAVENCYFTGAIEPGSGSLFGVVAYNFSGTTSSNYYNSDSTSSNSGVGGALDSDEMSNQSSFTGWDFTNVWKMSVCNNYVFPVLKWENPIRAQLSLSGNTLTASGIGSGLAYEWRDCNNSNSVIAGATNSTYVASVTGSYSVTISKSACVSSSICKEVTIASTGIHKEVEANLLVYPNPTSGSIIVSLIDDNEGLVEIYDVQGRYLSKKEYKGGVMNIDIEGPAGVYYVQLKTNGGIQTVRVVKQ
ncbi:MAG: T9SS type A sorting domain-containing protein [Cytophagaceae bacterium]